MKSKKLKKQLQSTDPNSLGIAKRLKEIRTKEGLTQLEWSKIINMSPPAVGALENAWYLPNLDVLKKIKKKYGYSYDFLLDGSDAKNSIEFQYDVKKLTKIVDKLFKYSSSENI